MIKKLKIVSIIIPAIISVIVFILFININGKKTYYSKADNIKNSSAIIVTDIDKNNNYSTDPEYTGNLKITVNSSEMSNYFNNYRVARGNGSSLGTPTFDQNGNVTLLTGKERVNAAAFTISKDYVDFKTDFHLNTTISDTWDKSMAYAGTAGGDGIDVMFAQNTSVESVLKNTSISPDDSLHFITGTNWGNLSNFPAPYNNSYKRGYWYLFSTLGAGMYAKYTDQYSGGLAKYILGGPGNVYSPNPAILASPNGGDIKYTFDISYKASSKTITTNLRLGDDSEGKNPILYTWTYVLGTSDNNANAPAIKYGIPTLFSVSASAGGSKGNITNRANYYEFMRAVVNLSISSDLLNINNYDSDTKNSFALVAPNQSGILSKPGDNILFYQGTKPNNPPISNGSSKLTYDKMYEVPNVAGYSLNPSKQNILLSGDESNNYKMNLTFTPDPQKLKVHYVSGSKSGPEIQSPTELTGVSDASVNYSSINKNITNYTLISDGTKDVTNYDHDDNTEQDVYLIYQPIEQVAKLVIDQNDSNGKKIYIPDQLKDITVKGLGNTKINFGIVDFDSSKGSSDSLYRPGYTYTVTDPKGNIYKNTSNLKSDQTALAKALNANPFNTDIFNNGSDPNPQVFTVTYTGMPLKVNYEIKTNDGKSIATLKDQLSSVTTGQETDNYFGKNGTNILNKNSTQLTSYLKNIFANVSNDFIATDTIIYKTTDSTLSPSEEFYDLTNKVFSENSNLNGINIPQYFLIPNFNVNVANSDPATITIQFIVSANGRNTIRAVPNLDFGINEMNISDNYNLANKITNNNNATSLNIDYKDSSGIPISTYLKTDDSTTPVKRILLLTNAGGNLNDPWHLECKIGSFTTDHNETINNSNITLNFKTKDISGVNDYGTSGTSMWNKGSIPNVHQTSISAGGSATTIIDSDKTNNSNAIGSWQLDFRNQDSASLYFPRSSLNELKQNDNQVKLHTTLTWTLISGVPN